MTDDTISSWPDGDMNAVPRIEVANSKRLLTIEQARAAFPSAPGKPAPSARWISREARRMGLARRCGKHVYILSEFLTEVVRCQSGNSSSTPPKRARKSGTAGAISPSGAKTEKSDTDRLSEVLALLRLQKRGNGQESSTSNTPKSPVVQFHSNRRSRES